MKMLNQQVIKENNLKQIFSMILKFGKEPAQSLEIWALSRFVYIGYTVLFGGKLKNF